MDVRHEPSRYRRRALPVHLGRPLRRSDTRMARVEGRSRSTPATQLTGSPSVPAAGSCRVRIARSRTFHLNRRANALDSCSSHAHRPRSPRERSWGKPAITHGGSGRFKIGRFVSSRGRLALLVLRELSGLGGHLRTGGRERVPGPAKADDPLSVGRPGSRVAGVLVERPARVRDVQAAPGRFDGAEH